MNEISCPEQRLGELLGPLLEAHNVGEALGISPSAESPLASFELFLPTLLHELNPEWKYESLDRIYPPCFRKTGACEIELTGLALLISDQTWTPFTVCLQLSPTYNFVSWIDLELGEQVAGQCRRDPYGSLKASQTMLRLKDQPDSFDWYYNIGFGHRDS